MISCKNLSTADLSVESRIQTSIKTQASNFACTRRIWNDLHRVGSGYKKLKAKYFKSLGGTRSQKGLNRIAKRAYTG